MPPQDPYSSARDSARTGELTRHDVAFARIQKEADSICAWTPEEDRALKEAVTGATPALAKKGLAPRGFQIQAQNSWRDHMLGSDAHPAAEKAHEAECIEGFWEQLAEQVARGATELMRERSDVSSTLVVPKRGVDAIKRRYHGLIGYNCRRLAACATHSIDHECDYYLLAEPYVTDVDYHYVPSFKSTWDEHPRHTSAADLHDAPVGHRGFDLLRLSDAGLGYWKAYEQAVARGELKPSLK